MDKLATFILWLTFCYNQIHRSRIYAYLDVYLYSTNQSESSEDNMIIPNSNETTNPDAFKLWINQSYGTLVMSERATDDGELAPIWKDVDEHLEDIDLYLSAVENVLLHKIYSYSWSDVWVRSGTSGVLSFYNGTRSTDEKQLMYSWSTKHECMVPIPKFICKVIGARCQYNHCAQRLEPHDKYYNAVIIIHNDPTTGSDSDDLLDCERLWSWGEIENTGETEGLTYVCHFTKELSEILGMYYPYGDEDSEPLNLDFLPYSHSSNWEYTSLTAPRVASDQRQVIYEEYRKLKGVESQIESEER